VRKFYLLADDDHDDAEMFGEALAGIDPPVDLYHAEDGQALFQFLGGAQSRKPDIIFLDLNMPEMSGWQCLAKLKNHTDYMHIPVIMYSTSSNPRDREIAIDLGAWGFLTKPDNFKILVKVLRSIAGTEKEDMKKVLREIVNS
jgi:CheY-like chemotaxis protein